MVKTTSSAKPHSDKPVEQFWTIRRPEITRLAESDPMPPPPANIGLGQGSGKDGRPLVSDLIQARETEAALHKQVEEEREKNEAFREEEKCRTARIIEEMEVELKKTRTMFS